MAACIALVLAGGSGERVGGGVPKQYRALDGKPVVRHSLERFAGHPGITAVCAVIRNEDAALYQAAASGLSLMTPVMGGPSRQESARAGLESLGPAGPLHVVIHDAARPLADAALIARTLAALGDHKAAVAAVPLTDTLKRQSGDEHMVAATVDRRGLWRAQTPQAFRFEEILHAHRAAAGTALTDDAAVAEHAGMTVALVAGSEDNIKITTEDDFARAERIIAARRGEVRTGTGFDVHRFGEGDHVMLCGVAVQHDRGLAGHSDADVGLHALTDAILGALAEGDIGQHFPPSDPRWRGAASEIFLRDAGQRVASRGGAIVHLDLTLICEAPKIAPHRAAMIGRIAGILGLSADRVSVKATTTEGLGFTGRGEGIAAQAIATICLPPA